MTVTVRFYAVDARGGGRTVTLDRADGLTVAALTSRVGAAPAGARRVLVNGVVRGASYALRPGDEVAVVPRVAGGAQAREFLHLRSVADARARFLSAWTPGPRRTEVVALAEACGRTLGQDVPASEDLPPHPRSVVDGYAVRAADTFGAGEGLPAYLTVTGDVQMGQPPHLTVAPGEAVRIPTGGVLPAGADAVIMVEHTEALDGAVPGPGAGPSAASHGIEARRPVGPGENVIQPGEDVRRGAAVLHAGTLLRAPHIGLLAGLGVVELHAAVRPRVAILSTGDELVPPSRVPEAGRVRDINGPALEAAVRAHGAVPIFCGIVPDEFAALLGAVRQAKDGSDLVLVSGGSSIGLRDEVSRAIDTLGAPGVLVHGVAMKPGKPTVLGLCGGTPIVGLPGHPTTVLTVFHVFVRDIIAGLLGCEPRRAAAVSARLTRRVASATGRTDYLRVRFETRDGELWAAPILGKSGLISTMAEADGLAVVPEAMEGIEMGDPVTVEVMAW